MAVANTLAYYDYGNNYGRIVQVPVVIGPCPRLQLLNLKNLPGANGLAYSPALRVMKEQQFYKFPTGGFPDGEVHQKDHSTGSRSAL
jgi:hypothetical protein